LKPSQLDLDGPLPPLPVSLLFEILFGCGHAIFLVVFFFPPFFPSYRNHFVPPDSVSVVFGRWVRVFCSGVRIELVFPLCFPSMIFSSFPHPRPHHVGSGAVLTTPAPQVCLIFFSSESVFLPSHPTLTLSPSPLRMYGPLSF